MQTNVAKRFKVPSVAEHTHFNTHESGRPLSMMHNTRLCAVRVEQSLARPGCEVSLAQSCQVKLKASENLLRLSESMQLWHET